MRCDINDTMWLLGQQYHNFGIDTVGGGLDPTISQQIRDIMQAYDFTPENLKHGFSDYLWCIIHDSMSLGYIYGLRAERKRRKKTK